MKKQIPNLLTLLNLVFGCLAIVMLLQNGMSLQYDNQDVQFVRLSENMVMGSIFIVLAAVADFFDGFAARLLKVSSPMGRELDSLSDLVSFGVAPAIILYQFLRMGFAQWQGGMEISLWVLSPAFVFAAAASYRLARFNLDVSASAAWFKGLPAPAAGLFTASFPMIYWFSGSSTLVAWITHIGFLYLYILISSVLMISRLPVISMKFGGGQQLENRARILLLGIAVAAIFLLQWSAAFVIFPVYIFLSLIIKKRVS